MQNPLLNLLAADLEAGGWSTRFRNPRTLEVYGVNLSEHYLLTLTKSREASYDLLFIPQLQNDKRAGDLPSQRTPSSKRQRTTELSP